SPPTDTLVWSSSSALAGSQAASGFIVIMVVLPRQDARMSDPRIEASRPDRYNCARLTPSSPDESQLSPGSRQPGRLPPRCGNKDEPHPRTPIKEGGDPTMRASLALALIVAFCSREARATEQPARPLPAVAKGWSIELVAEAPRILYPTAIVAAPDGTIYLGS